MAGKNVSSKFFGAAGTYSNFNSTAVAQQLTSQLAGVTPTTQAAVSSTNVIDVAQEQAGKQIDALAAATKTSLSEQISSVGNAAASAGKAPPTIVTTATLTATTSAAPAKTGGAASGDAATSTAPAGSTVQTTATGSPAGAAGDATAGATTATPPAATTQKAVDVSKATEADASKVTIEATPDELASATPPPAAAPPTPVVAVVPVIVTPSPATPWLTYVLYAVAAVLLLVVLSIVGYMVVKKKSLAETWSAFKSNFSSVATTADK